MFRPLVPAMLLSALAVAPQFSAAAPAAPQPAPQTLSAVARTQWFREARLGIFIHWGVYSVPAGEYKGRPIGWIGEWIMKQAPIPVADYRAFTRDFTASPPLDALHPLPN